jgi:hypothetical protein
MRRKREGDDVIEDGGELVVPLELCDSTQREVAMHYKFNAYDYQPGFRGGDVGVGYSQDARAAARDARARYVDNLTNAWRTPARDAAQPDIGSPPAEMMRRHLGGNEPDDAQARRDRAYREYTTRISEAWKGAAPGRAASRIEQQAERWRGGR